MFRLNRRCFYEKIDIKPQLELLAFLHPQIASYPYFKEKDNLAKETLWNKLIYKEDEKLYRAHTAAKQETYDEKALQPIDYVNPDVFTNWEDRLLSVLYALMQYKDGELKKRIGYPVWLCYLRNRNGGNTIHTISLKLISLYLQLRLIDAEFDTICRELMPE